MFNKVNNTSKILPRVFQDIQLKKKLTDAEKLIFAKFQQLREYREVPLRKVVHKAHENLSKNINALKGSISTVYRK